MPVQLCHRSLVHGATQTTLPISVFLVGCIIVRANKGHYNQWIQVAINIRAAHKAQLSNSVGLLRWLETSEITSMDLCKTAMGVGRQPMPEQAGVMTRHGNLGFEFCKHEKTIVSRVDIVGGSERSGDNRNPRGAIISSTNVSARGVATDDLWKQSPTNWSCSPWVCREKRLFSKGQFDSSRRRGRDWWAVGPVGANSTSFRAR